MVPVEPAACRAGRGRSREHLNVEPQMTSARARFALPAGGVGRPDLGHAGTRVTQVARTTALLENKDRQTGMIGETWLELWTAPAPGLPGFSLA